MQYHDLPGAGDVPTDGVGKLLDYIRLKWQRHGEDNEVHAKGKVFALCPLDIIRGRIHIAQANALLDMIHGKVLEKAAEEPDTGQDAELQSDKDKVNRFFRHDKVHFTVQE